MPIIFQNVLNKSKKFKIKQILKITRLFNILRVYTMSYKCFYLKTTITLQYMAEVLYGTSRFTPKGQNVLKLITATALP